MSGFEIHVRAVASARARTHTARHGPARPTADLVLQNNTMNWHSACAKKRATLKRTRRSCATRLCETRPVNRRSPQSRPSSIGNGCKCTRSWMRFCNQTRNTTIRSRAGHKSRQRPANRCDSAKPQCVESRLPFTVRHGMNRCNQCCALQPVPAYRSVVPSHAATSMRISTLLHLGGVPSIDRPPSQEKCAAQRSAPLRECCQCHPG